MSTHPDPVPDPVPTLSRTGVPGTVETTLSHVPLSSMGTGSTSPPRPCPGTDTAPSPRTTGGRWLVTPRTAPAWQSILDLLDDNHWHPRSEVEHLLATNANLASRTIASYLNSASARGWINIRRGRIRLRHAHLIEADLEAFGGAR